MSTRRTSGSSRATRRCSRPAITSPSSPRSREDGEPRERGAGNRSHGTRKGEADLPLGAGAAAHHLPPRGGLRHRPQYPAGRRARRPRLDGARARGSRRKARAGRGLAAPAGHQGGSHRGGHGPAVISNRVQGFTESVIREMTRINNQHQGINLAQGMPNFLPPKELLDAAHSAIDGDFHQYAITGGTPRLRKAIAEKYRKFYEMEVDPERNVTVCCGSTETMLATLLALLNPGDEVIIFEPFYENYGPGCIIAGAEPVWVPLEPPSFTFDPDRLHKAVSPRTRAIVFNSPNNPSGKVFSRAELQQIADLCLTHNLLAITDEIYEHIVYDGVQHIPIATLPGMAERTITISGISKSYSVTGWRIGYAVAPPDIAVGIRRAHDFVTVGAPLPLQEAAVVALTLPDSYYVWLREMYQAKRDVLFGWLEKAGFVAWKPHGAYYILTDAAHFLKRHGIEDDTAFAMFLIKHVGVATVPGSSFYAHPELGRTKIRFCFPKTDEVLQEAGERLQKLRS